MRFLTVLILSLAFGLPALSQDMPEDPPPDETPPEEPPPPPEEPPMTDDPPPDEDPVEDEPSIDDAEKARLKLLEKDAKAKVDELQRRMKAAKTDAERSMAFNEVAQNNPVVHPLVAKAMLAYLDYKPQANGVKYAADLHLACIDGLKLQTFDVTCKGALKWMRDNIADKEYTLRIIPLFGVLRNPLAVPDLVKFLKDKREVHLDRARAAVTAMGLLGHRDCVLPLIQELEEQDKAGRNDPKAKTRREYLNTEIVAALKLITGETTLAAGSQWRKWWNQNQSTFQKQPKPNPDEGSGGN